MTYAVAVIGTGPGREVDISGRSHAFGYEHADAYAARDDCELVACADIVPEYARGFADEYDIPVANAFGDHADLLAAVDLDLVSVCTPIPTHADIVIDCARAGVAGVHCEKPMAHTWADARGMAHICDQYDVQLTIGHQRRFGEPFTAAKRVLDDGTIGELERIEISWGNFFDNGTHTIDLAGMFNDEESGAWVMGQLDYSKEHVRYGVHTADHAFMSWQYENGVHAVLATGDDVALTDGPFDFFDCIHRLVGTDGVIEIGRYDGPPLRYRVDGAGWSTVDVTPAFAGHVDRAIDDVLTALDGHRESQLRVEVALQTAEILFAGHESVRRRGRIELPLSGVYDHPLESLVESGEVTPEATDDRPPHPAADR